MTQIITNFCEISDQYDAAFVDLWGCMHNGITAFAAAVEAMQAYRAKGGKVVFVTNAPRAWNYIAEQIDTMGIPSDSYDAIATSGDAARVALFTGAVGQNVYFMGEESDLTFFETPKILDDPLTITRTSLEDADGIVVCGPFDSKADPDVNRPAFLHAKTKGLKLLCANPDIMIDRGEEREWCAGALAHLYTQMGGESLYFGKPHPPIYDLARRRLSALSDVPHEPKVIAIGDGIQTDILGAMGEDLDSLFITGGLAAAETKTKNQPDADALTDYIQKEKSNPTYAIGFLR